MSNPSLRFAVLWHQTPGGSTRSSHYDLLLEFASELFSWELAERILIADGSTRARQLPNHRLFYLDYQGPVPHDRGRVDRVAAGNLIWLRDPNLSPQQLNCELHEDDRRWECQLTADPQDPQTWVVEWHRLG